MREELTPAEFTRRFPALFTTSAFRLETLPSYLSDIEKEPFRKFLAGEPDDLLWRRPWQRLVSEAVAAGKTMRRVHIVQEPLSDYLRFELDRIYPASVAAGEDVRILTAGDTDLLAPDFWLVDSVAAVMAYGDDGTWLGVTLTSDPVTVADYVAWRDILLRESIPLNDYIGHAIRRTA